MGVDRPIDITADQRKTLLSLLKRHLPNTTAWVYGSRVKWTARPQSDLDLVVFATPDQERRVAELREAFEESNLPFRVDLFIWDAVPEQFRKEIEAEHVVLVEKEVRTIDSAWRETVYGRLPADFCENSLANLCHDDNGVQTGPFGSQLHQKDYVRTGTPILTVEHLGENRVIHQDLPHVSDYDKERLSKYTLRKGDIVFSRVGSVDRRALVREAEDGWLFSGRCLRVRPDPDKIDSGYLSYFFGWASFQEYIRSIAVGATMPSLNTQILSDVVIPYPSLPEQRAIAHVLGTLDDKIELNRRMNETLEAMARALFKSWFIDFDPVRAKMAGHDPGLPKHLADLFPNHLADSELGPIPEGWEVKRIEDIAERVAMGPFGSSIKVSTFVDQGIPVISGQHLKGMLLDDDEYRFISQEHADKLEKANVRRGDVIFTHAGSIGQVSCIPLNSQFERYVISQRQFYMRCDDSKISPLFIVHFFKTPEGQHKLLANTSSTGVPSISRPVTYLRSIKLCLPPKSLWYRFSEIVGGLHLKTEWTTAESRTLATQRDTLLPKLISGEIKVENEVCYD